MLYRQKSVMLMRLAILVVIGTSAIACNDSKFAGTTNKKVIPPPPAEPAEPAKILPVQLTCLDTDVNANNKTVSIKGKRQDKVKIQGEFCPRIFAELNVLFVIDTSGSMNTNDPSSTGTCGRAASVKAITDRLVATIRTQDKVNAGVVSFSTSAFQAVSLTPIAQFQSGINASLLCPASGSTNYGAALSTARQMLANAPGTKVIYFITDGQPQVYNSGGGRDTQAEAEGLTAAQQLMTLPNTTLNAIYLGASQQDNYNYLTQLTGSQDRVRLVSNADQLADEILKFALPEISVVESSVRGRVKVESSTTQQDVAIKTFQKIANRTGVWNYETEPFSLVTSANARSIHQFTITAQDKSGKDQVSTVTIDFQALD